MTKKPDYYVARDHHTEEIIAILTPEEYEALMRERGYIGKEYVLKHGYKLKEATT